MINRFRVLIRSISTGGPYTADASARFAVVPSTGAALLLVRDVNRHERFGLTLDVGHLMAAGENPAASAAAAAAGRGLHSSILQLNVSTFCGL